MANRKRPHQLKCRLSDEELSKFKALLEESGLTTQEFMQRAITTKRFTVTKSSKVESGGTNKQLAEFNFLLARIGGNLNQIAKALNEREKFVDYNNILGNIKELQEQINTIKEKSKGDDFLEKYFS